MNTEYEATFENVDKEKIRIKLKEIGARLVKKETLMKRYVFYLPKNKDLTNCWLRVRDEEIKLH